jgi:hypothetical protein
MPIRKVTSWLRQGGRKSSERRRFESALERLSRRDVADTVSEHDVQAWMALLESGGAAPSAAEPKPRTGGR